MSVPACPAGRSERVGTMDDSQERSQPSSAILVAGIMIALGIVAVLLAFTQYYPNADTPGAMFVAAGFLLIAADRICSRLDSILEELQKRDR